MHAKVSCSFFILHFSFYSPHPSILPSMDPSPRDIPQWHCVFFLTIFVQPRRTNNENHLSLSLSLFRVPSAHLFTLLLSIVAHVFMFFFFFVARKEKKKLLICQINVVFLVRMPYFQCIGGSPEQALSVIFARRHKRMLLLSRNTPSYFFYSPCRVSSSRNGRWNNLCSSFLLAFFLFSFSLSLPLFMSNISTPT